MWVDCHLVHLAMVCREVASLFAEAPLKRRMNNARAVSRSVMSTFPADIATANMDSVNCSSLEEGELSSWARFSTFLITTLGFLFVFAFDGPCLQLFFSRLRQRSLGLAFLRRGGTQAFTPITEAG